MQRSRQSRYIPQYWENRLKFRVNVSKNTGSIYAIPPGCHPEQSVIPDGLYRESTFHNPSFPKVSVGNPIGLNILMNKPGLCISDIVAPAKANPVEVSRFSKRQNGSRLHQGLQPAEPLFHKLLQTIRRRPRLPFANNQSCLNQRFHDLSDSRTGKF